MNTSEAVGRHLSERQIGVTSIDTWASPAVTSGSFPALGACPLARCSSAGTCSARVSASHVCVFDVRVRGTSAPL